MQLFKATIKFLSPIKTTVHPSNALIASDTFVSGLMCNAALVNQAELFKQSLLTRAVEFSSIFSKSEPEYLFKTRTAVHRITNETNPFSQWHQHNPKAYFWFRCTNLKNVLAIIRLLGDTGLGGQRSNGSGRFEVVKYEEYQETPNKQLVSLTVPTEEDKKLIRDKNIEWILRSGYTEESWQGTHNRYKDGIWAIKEGVKLNPEVKGTMTFFDSVIFHYGHAMFVGIN